MNGSINEFGYETLKAFALTHNYNRWIFDTFRPYIGKNILEIGSGIGNLTVYLKQVAEKLTGIDTSELFLKHLKIDYPDVDLYNYDMAGDELLSLEGRNFDTIVCINVLEHVKDDARALNNSYRLLKTGGRLLLFVPAMPSIYGTLDKNLEHFRRYGKGELKEKLAGAGYTVESITYSNLPGIIGWYINGKLLRKTKFPILQPIFFDKLVPLISRIEKLLKPPIGMNLVAVARKT